ncbi:MAG: hypothetical protein QNJ54_03145 [Prochloraceae cyanobacterium]|nr:hypothetical protein [Prochloraceae cyanobacterium]
MGLELESGRHQDQTQQSKQTSQESLQGQNSSPQAQVGSQPTPGLYPGSGMQAKMGEGFAPNNFQVLAPSATNSDPSSPTAQQNSPQQPAASLPQIAGQSRRDPLRGAPTPQHRGASRREARQPSSRPSENNSSSSQINSVPNRNGWENSSTQQNPSQLSTTDNGNNAPSQNNPTSLVQTPTDSGNNAPSQNNSISAVETPQFDRTSNKPIFAAADENAIENLNPSQILGKTADGKTLYETSDPQTSQEAAKSGATVTELPSSQTEQIRQQQNTKATLAIASLPAAAQGKMQRLDSIGATVQPRISAATTQAVGKIQNAQNASSNNLTSQIAQMRASMSAKAQSIKTQITASHQNTIASIKSKTAAAKQRLASEYQNNLQQLTSLEASLEAKINTPFEKTHGDFLRVGNAFAKIAISIGDRKAQEFASQSPPKPSNAITKALDSIDRSSYEQNWRAAKEKAAREVAAQYQQTVIAQASNSAQQLLSSKEQIISKTRELISQTKEALKAKLDAANQKIDSAEQQSITSASSTLDRQLQQVDSTLNQNLASLDGVKSSGLAAINSTATSQLAAVRQQGNALTASLQQGIATAKTNITQALAQFNANLTSAQTPAPAAAQSSVKEARAFLDQKINTTVTQLETGINNGASQVTQSGQSAVSSINNAASQAISTVENTASQSNSALDELKASADNSFTQLENGHSQTVDNTVSEASNFFSQQSSNLGSKIDSVVTNLNGKLAESTNQLTSALRHSLTQERADIDKAANEAAAKVQPAWKKIVSVAIDVVITVGTTVAIAALAASGVGLVAAIGLAALIGAAGGLARQAANDALNGHMSSWQEYAKQGAIGAGSGVLQLLGGKAVEKFASPLASKLAQKAAQIGIDTTTNTLTDLGSRLANGEKLTLSTVGISLGSSLLGSAGGEALSGSFGKLAKKVQLDKVDNKLLQSSSDLVFDTVSNVTVDMANLTLLQGQSLSWNSFGESVGSSALGHVTGKKIHSHNNNRFRSFDRSDSNSQRIRQQPEINNNLTTGDRASTRRPDLDKTGDRYRRRTQEAPESANNRVDSQQNRTTESNNLQRAENFDKYLTPQTRGKVPIYVDPELKGNTVRVHYDVDSNGLVKNIHMRCGPDAKAMDIALHDRTARTMQRYSGFSGRVMKLKNRLQKLVGRNGEPPVGSRAWEARMEVDKLNKIVRHRLDMKAELGLKDNNHLALDEEIKNLEIQLARHEKTLEEMNTDPGIGYVAAEGENRENAGKKSVLLKSEDDRHSESWENVQSWLSEDGILNDDRRCQKIYQDVLNEMPDSIKQKLGNTTISKQQYQKWLEEWSEASIHNETTKEKQSYTYDKNQEGAEQLLKDAILNQIHKEHGWEEIGFAEYMTGDASAAALATAMNENTTLRVLKGNKKTGKSQKTPSVFQGEQRTLPSSFDEALQRGQIVTEEVDGTQDAYEERYKPYGNNHVKPWQKESWRATQIVADQYNKPGSREAIEKVLLPPDQQTRDEVKKYKDTLPLGNKPSLLVWGRNSGSKGGAHPELDSHPEVLSQTIQTIAKDSPDRVIVLTGDKVLTPEHIQQLREQGVKNEIVYMEEYWKKNDWKSNDRRAQNYLSKLLKEENDAVSIGMRSGGLESSALLQMKTIYMDDRACDRTSGDRMEMWAGKGAYDRDDLIRQRSSDEQLNQHEQNQQGVIPSYKRIRTSNQLGNQIDERARNSQVVREDLNKILSEKTGKQQPKQEHQQAIDILAELSDRIPNDNEDPNIFLSDVNKLLKRLYKDKKLSTRNFDTTKIEKVLKCIKYANENNTLTESEKKQISFLFQYLTNNTN